jgi:hypothetical protein
MAGKARGATGRDAAYTKVKQILPHCEDEDIHAALQNAFGDADQAVIALTSAGSAFRSCCRVVCRCLLRCLTAHQLCARSGQEWTAVDKKTKKKGPVRGVRLAWAWLANSPFHLAN